jgi:hypothetical protein
LEIGGELLEKLRASLTPIMQALGYMAVARWEQWQYIGKAVLQELSGENSSVSFLEFINEFDDLFQEIQNTKEFQDREQAIQQAKLCFQIAVKEDCTIDGDFLLFEVASILKEAGFLKQNKYPLCASPDIFLGSPSTHHIEKGEAIIYLGEMHHHLFTMFYETSVFFCPWQEHYRRQVRHVLEALALPKTPLYLMVKRDSKLFPAELDGTKVYFQEAIQENGCSTSVSIHDLCVAEKDGEVVLQNANNGLLYVFPGHIVKDPSYEFLSIFTFPKIDYIPAAVGDKWPHIIWNGIVYQRKGWHLKEEDLRPLLNSSGFDLFWSAYQFKEKHEMPSCIFVRHPLEKKPFFVDFQNFFLLEMFQHFLRAAQDVWVSEFAPNEEELWFKIGEDAYCCEFRLGMYVQE